MARLASPPALAHEVSSLAQQVQRLGVGLIASTLSRHPFEVSVQPWVYADPAMKEIAGCPQYVELAEFGSRGFGQHRDDYVVHTDHVGVAFAQR